MKLKMSESNFYNILLLNFNIRSTVASGPIEIFKQDYVP